MLFRSETAAVADAHQGPDRVEEVDEEEREHDDPEIEPVQHGEVQLSKDRRDRVMRNFLKLFISKMLR